VIGAAGITVDLNGHTIDGTVTQVIDCDVAPFGAAGISAGGYDRLTIKNGTIQQFAGGLNGGSDTAGMADSTLRDLTVRDNRFGGITLGSAQPLNNNNRIVGNDVYGNGCGDGISLNDARGNIVRGAGADGVLVDAAAEGTVLERNYALDAGDDGIHVDSAASALTGNRAFFNHDLGIEAVPGVTDGGGNRARQNGNPAQCSGVACR
jgi:hypothetical protein